VIIKELLIFEAKTQLKNTCLNYLLTHLDNHALKNTDHVWMGTFTDSHNRLTLMGCLKAR
jgi:hypothetical protein